MKILLTGAGGQLGQALLDAKPEAFELISTTRQELNLADAGGLPFGGATAPTGLGAERRRLHSRGQGRVGTRAGPRRE